MSSYRKNVPKKSHRTIYKIDKRGKTSTSELSGLDKFVDIAAHTIGSIKTGIDDFREPFMLPEDVNKKLSLREYNILHKIHELQSSDPGNVRVETYKDFDPKKMKIDLTYNGLKNILKKDRETMSEHNKNYKIRPYLEKEIDEINEIIRKEEIRRLKLQEDISTEPEQIFYLYNLLKNLSERDRYLKDEAIGIYHRFEGSEDELKDFINNGKIKVRVGDLICEAKNCKENNEVTSTPIRRQSASRSRRRSTTRSPGSSMEIGGKKSKTRRRRGKK